MVFLSSQVTEKTVPPPEEMDLMSFIFACDMEKQKETEARGNCETNCANCEVNSDSQFDHCQTGNCLDTKISQNHVYFEPAKKRVKVEELINVFDKVHSEIGVKLIFAKQLAKCAVALIPLNEMEKWLYEAIKV